MPTSEGETCESCYGWGIIDFEECEPLPEAICQDCDGTGVKQEEADYADKR